MTIKKCFLAILFIVNVIYCLDVKVFYQTYQMNHITEVIPLFAWSIDFVAKNNSTQVTETELQPEL